MLKSFPKIIRQYIRKNDINKSKIKINLLRLFQKHIIQKINKFILNELIKFLLYYIWYYMYFENNIFLSIRIEGYL